MSEMDNIIKIIKELGGVTALIFIFVYVIFYKIFPMLRERDAEVKEAQNKFSDLTTKFLETIHQFNRALDDLGNKIEENSEKIELFSKRLDKKE